MRFRKLALALSFAASSLTTHAKAQVPSRARARPVRTLRICTATSPGYAPSSKLAGMQQFFWKNGSNLRVKFMNGSPGLQKKVFNVARTWSKFAHIKFKLVASGPAEIRIRFHDNYDNDNGSWSKIGTGSLYTPAGSHTMNFGWLTDSTEDQEVKRVVLHEFGHALGLIHEHQNPAAHIQWNRPVVYNYYARQGWGQSQVNSNIFATLSEGITNSAYDPKSIMHYAIPQEFTLDGFSVGWNVQLSSRDKAFVGRLYPIPAEKSMDDFDDLEDSEDVEDMAWAN